MLIAVCEDTPRDMEAILDLCDRYSEAEGFKFECLVYAHAKALLEDARAREADILLLDIMMPGPDGSTPAGVELSRQLRAEGYAGAIVFTTTSLDFFQEGFEVEAAHYLIKPLQYEAFREGMARAMRRVKKPERTITVPVNRIQLCVEQRSILYAEVYGRETMLHTTGEALRVLLPLKEIEEMLDAEMFLRCYRSYIVNMLWIHSMEEDHFILKNGVKIPMSLRNRQKLKSQYFAFRLLQLE